jgi:hypothetical protein
LDHLLQKPPGQRHPLSGHWANSGVPLCGQLYEPRRKWESCKAENIMLQVTYTPTTQIKILSVTGKYFLIGESNPQNSFYFYPSPHPLLFSWPTIFNLNCLDTSSQPHKICNFSKFYQLKYLFV